MSRVLFLTKGSANWLPYIKPGVHRGSVLQEYLTTDHTEYTEKTEILKINHRNTKSF